MHITDHIQYPFLLSLLPIRTTQALTVPGTVFTLYRITKTLCCRHQKISHCMGEKTEIQLAKCGAPTCAMCLVVLALSRSKVLRADRKDQAESHEDHNKGFLVFNWHIIALGASQAALVVKNPAAYAEDIRDVGSIPGSGRSAGGGRGNPLQYSCLENPMDREAWRATVCGVTKSQTQLKKLSMHACIMSLHCCVSFCYTTKWISYMYTHIPSLNLSLTPHPSPQVISRTELSPLWYPADPRQLSVMHMVVYEHQ